MSIAWIMKENLCSKLCDLKKNYFGSNIIECIMGRLYVL